MAVISGGNVIADGTAANPGTKARVIHVDGVPTDANVGVSPLVNGMLADNVNTGFMYERQAGAWVRVDTL